jgi:hypothetical protein
VPLNTVPAAHSFKGEPMRLRRCDLAVLDAILWYHVRYQTIFPKQTTLAARAGMKPRNLRGVLKRLKTCGYLEVFGCGPHASEYVLTDLLFAEQDCQSIAGLLPVNCRSSPPLIGSKNLRYITTEAKRKEVQKAKAIFDRLMEADLNRSAR